ncbi:50S ribosomal protein L1 [Candidatus Woesearchaeota archaeon]|nr:50S ribosomal protein L1 [Candidatus Woesearchaeota archaeon]
MDKATFLEAIKALNELPQKKFKQTYELIINLRDLDLKKPEEQVELWVQLPADRGIPTKIAALVGPELAEQAKTSCDTVILHDQFPRYAADKKTVKKLAATHTYFIAQANIMPDVAKTFGRVLGPRGKMPNPKAGCVVPPNANLKTLTEKLRKTVKVSAKVQPSIKVAVGTQNIKEEQVAENISAIHTSVVQKLPEEQANIRNIMLKLTMSPPVKITNEGIVKPVIKEEKKDEGTKDVGRRKKEEEKKDEGKAEEGTPEKTPAKPKRAKKTETPGAA